MNAFLPRRTKRLKALYAEAISFGDKQKVVADVGCDHGYLAAMLAQSNKFKKVVASDISAPSLQKTAELAKKYNLDIQTIVAFGLDYNFNVDVACICGMGGYEIVEILKKFGKKIQFVFQPVQNHEVLRKYLVENNYKIEKDYVLEQAGKFYFILVTNFEGKNNYNAAELAFGKTNLTRGGADFVKYLKSQQNQLKFLQNFDKTNTSEHEQIAKKFEYKNMVDSLLKNLEGKI